MIEAKEAPTQDRSEEVLYEVSDAIATLTLNRPERLNTISGPMLARLTQLLIKANEDPAVRVIVLTGTGRAFCAGLDLVDATQGSGIGSDKQVSTISVNLDLRNTPPTVLFASDKPTICALNGSAAGYGMDTAMGCDIRIAGESAKMAAAFVKRGVVPESGGTWILPRLLGWAKAAELIFTGRTLSARESLELGLVNHVVPDAELAAKTREIALEMAANAPLAVQSAKRLMRMGLTETFNDHVHHVYLQFLQLIRTQDFKEGMTSFLEKRPADFQGR
ncbi:enoyl-CoA hydratase/isomerase family protein [Phenylobacterium sp. Root700]|uniref:enoyl-CoA hydratase/isomerase family protein n=1 Tax=Phenylobacterium sp. Root700 TaxID=1736591 RepID=UPI0006FEEBE0|nr:enoyl-CoA hydratase-related protein [Phenylobacterium sp. Root700]KRB52570.1 enoyl-CoA hydratase [Phenylobacterium sp. Root700]